MTQSLKGNNECLFTTYSFVLWKIYISIINDYICKEWIGPSEESSRSFATNHDIDEKTVRRIKDWKTSPYNITLYTLEKICTARDLTLEDFFGLIKR